MKASIYFDGRPWYTIQAVEIILLEG